MDTNRLLDFLRVVHRLELCTLGGFTYAYVCCISKGLVDWVDKLEHT